MRKLVAFLFLFCGLIVNGQVVPQGINYQAVALDQQGQPIPGVDIVGRPIDDAEIGVRISILEASPTGNVLYQEEHEVLTDQYGMFNLTIGQGLQVSADAFNTINWQGDKFLQVELSIENDGAFTLSAVQQLMSVPYAFLADRALNVDDADADPTNELQALSISNDTLYLSSGGYVVLPSDQINDADADPTNELQAISMSNDTLYLGSGGFVVLPPDQINDADADPTNEFQTITRNGSTINLSGNGGSVTVFDGDYTNLTNTPTIPSKTSDLVNDSGFITSEQDADSTNELQSLSISGDSLTISAGNTVLLPTSNDLDKDPKNELQQLYVQNDSLFLTADTTGIGYALDPNNRTTEIIDFNKTNCFPIPRVDSLLQPSSGFGGQGVFVEKRNGNVLLSHGDMTIIIDSSGNRITEYSLGLRWGFTNTNNLAYIQNGIPLFNNGMVDASNFPFCALRTYNINGDTIGSNVILDSNYLLLLDSSGDYLAHVGIDSLINIGVTNLKLQAVNTTSLYFSYNHSDNYFLGEFIPATGLITYPSHIQNSFPLFTVNNEYWVNTSVHSDSCLVISKEVNGTLSQVYNTDTALIYYYYYFFNTSFYSTGYVTTYPTKSKSGLIRFNDPAFYSSIISNDPTLSYVDTAFQIIESPVMLAYGDSPSILRNTFLYSQNSTHHFVHQIPLEFSDGNLLNPSIRYQNKYFAASKDFNQRLQFSFNVKTMEFSHLISEPRSKTLDKLYSSNYGNGSQFIVFQDFGELVIGQYPSNSNCFSSNASESSSYYYVMKKDDFESYFIH